VILLRYTSAFGEVIYGDFYAKILDWNFGLVDENSQIFVVVFVSKLNFSFSFRFVDENCRIFVVVVAFVTKINLFSSTKIFVFVVVDEKNTDIYSVIYCDTSHYNGQDECNYTVCVLHIKTRHRASTSIRWHFAFGAMLSWQRNSCTDCKFAQWCTTTIPQLTSGSVQWCGNAARDRHTDGRDQYTFCLGYISRET